jgi:hypothetical protein
MNRKYLFRGEELELAMDLVERALVLLATENPAAVKLAEAYLSICHDALLNEDFVEG